MRDERCGGKKDGSRVHGRVPPVFVLILARTSRKDRPLEVSLDITRPLDIRIFLGLDVDCDPSKNRFHYLKYVFCNILKIQYKRKMASCRVWASSDEEVWKSSIAVPMYTCGPPRSFHTSCIDLPLRPYTFNDGTTLWTHNRWLG